ncbi:cell wall hydrolase [Limoniibacter endophyticus]|uniref:ATP-binding protein n=1 Tax=Limoniibacter endophyticus TaxID=1565040 RepID=A0A8J3GGX3_9HYPH|nr:cell wall hydrolase [Limoniibacter endophyticus]GHC71242.1 ATP-binding protein [Limoniibacter endophyticus]
MFRKRRRPTVYLTAEPRRSFVSPVVFGLGALLLSSSQIAYQDMTSILASAGGVGERWASYIERSAAGGTQIASLPFGGAEGMALSGGGVRTANLGEVTIRAKDGSMVGSDESRINRAEKTGRLVKVAPTAPPKAFSAGTILQRTSLLKRPSELPKREMAFIVPKIAGKELQIAGNFHNTPPKVTEQIPVAIASLVTNDTPDVLAYAPSEPNYAKQSPFSSLLRKEDPNEGRFIPPIGENDHGWMASPLPPKVFSSAEQKCLATAIYFEARSEPKLGQAAVAQVVLNRVRNPAYPNTICGVVYQNDDWLNRCQFSFACEGRKKVVYDRKRYKLAEEIALAVTSGAIFIPEVGSSTHYHATYVRPKWAPTMTRLTKIGLHIFYRTKNGGWS